MLVLYKVQGTVQGTVQGIRTVFVVLLREMTQNILELEQDMLMCVLCTALPCCTHALSVAGRPGHISFCADDIDLETNITKNIKIKVSRQADGTLSC